MSRFSDARVNRVHPLCAPSVSSASWTSARVKIVPGVPVEDPPPRRGPRRTAHELPMEQPERAGVLQERVPAPVEEQRLAQPARRHRAPAASAWPRRVLQHAGHQAPVADRRHHVLADAELHHRVFGLERVRIRVGRIHRLLQPRIPERKGLVARERHAFGNRHWAGAPPFWADCRAIPLPSSAESTLQCFPALNAGRSPDRTRLQTVFLGTFRYSATSARV